MNKEPKDFFTGNVQKMMTGWQDKSITPERIAILLDCGLELEKAVERWHSAGLWVISTADTEYPQRLRERLTMKTPPLFFGAGNRRLFDTPGLAVVGSRNVSDEDMKYSRELGRAAAQQGYSIVSGGARGIDENAMLGALEAEGTTIGFLADSLLRVSASQKSRRYITNNDLLLVSPFNPDAGFNVGNAMARNKYIYCQSDAAVVVRSGHQRRDMERSIGKP